MMDRLRPLSAAILSATILISPVFGANIAGLGTVVYADRANVGTATASVGTTVFGGDRLITSPKGSIQVRAGAARFLLSGTSSATLLQEEASPAARLTLGSATFSTARADAFSLHVFAAVIRANSDGPTVGRVTVLGPNEMLVVSTRGALACTVAGETRVINEGESYRVVIAPEAAAAQGPAGNGTGSGHAPVSPGRSKAIYYIGAAVVGITVFAIHKALESPDRP